MLREDGRMCPMTKCSCSYYDLLTCNYTLFLLYMAYYLLVFMLTIEEYYKPS